MSIDLTMIIKAVITLIGLVFTVFLIPLLKSKLSAQQYETLMRWANVAVYAAEQVKDLGADKKKYAQEYLAAKGYDINSEEVDAAIEAEVKKLKISLSN